MSKNDNKVKRDGKPVSALAFFILFLASAALNVMLATGCCVSKSKYNRVVRERDEYRNELWRIAKDVGVGHGLTPESARENIEKRFEELKYSGETMSEQGRMVSAKEALTSKDWMILQSYHKHAMSTTNLVLGRLIEP